MWNFKKIFSFKKTIIISLAVIIVIISVTFGFLLNFKSDHIYDLFDLAPEYAQAFSLVNEKISQSANITITLPDDVNPAEAMENIEFTPAIKGQWLDSQFSNQLVFKPEIKLKIGNYYTITLNTANGTIGKDFLIEEDPAVIAVFPKADSETHEKENITIIFNRPMVPLSSLNIMADGNIPVEILPSTPGRFKWIGTRSLQFIPEKNLIPSANYNIKIKSDFTSMDGLSIDNFTHHFTTRNLRYEYISENRIIYNQPAIIRFNQPINLEKTKKEIWLKNNTEDKQVDFIAEYGTKKIYNKETKKYDELEDNTVIFIYNKKDRHDRDRLWDFNNNYYLFIEKAYPLEGDVIIDYPNEVNLNVTDIIDEITAESDRTNYTSPDFFDYYGKLWITFFEEIDLKKSDIVSEKMINIGYGEKCKDDQSEIYYSSDVECEKVIDQKKIFIIFDKNKIGFEEELKIEFNKIINIDNQQINKEPLVNVIKTVPKLYVRKTIPGNNQTASLTSLIMCSNSPINPISIKEDIGLYFKLKPAIYENINWGGSYRVDYNYDNDCLIGEFKTTIYYRLAPKTDYKLDLKLVSNFDSEENIRINFKTEEIPEYFLNFYHFQKKYNVTPPEKTKLTYAVENIDYVDMHICKLEAKNMLNYLKHNPDYAESPKAISDCIEESDHVIRLEEKFWEKNYFQVDLKDYVKAPFGHYLLTFSNPRYNEQYGQRRKVYERTYLTITNLAVVKKEINIGDVSIEEQKRAVKNLYWVTDLKNLENVAGAKIETFSTEKNSILKEDEFYTDKSGIVNFQATSSLCGIVVSKNGDSAIVSNDYNEMESVSSAYENKKIYVYSDRPIYKPGQEVKIKGLYRIGYDGNYEIFNQDDLEIKIFNSKSEEIFSNKIDVNDFGTFNTEFSLSADSPLGSYRIEVNGLHTASFDVEEYVPAPFKVETKLDKEEYISGDTFKLNLDANYYFGAPLEGGEIEYSIASQNYYFDKYKGDYFDFGSSWYYCYWGCSYEDKFILRNKIKLGADGKASISHNIDFNQLFKDANKRESKIFVIYVTVKNSSGQSVSSEKSFIVHNGEFYLGLNTDESFVRKNQEFTAKLKAVDINGEDIKVKDINFSINKVEWITSKRKEVDGGYYYKWEEKLTPIIERKISTAGDGYWDDKFSIKEEGTFNIIVEAIDNAGNKIKNNYNVYVYGDAIVDITPSNDDSLEIITNKSNLKVGDIGEVIITSPYKNAKALIATERGKIFDYEIVDINESIYNYKFEIKDEYAPNIYLSATLLSNKPEIKYGNVQFQVDIEKKELDIEVTSNKINYLPGEEVILDVVAKNNDGNPEEAEISIAVADLSVLALKGNPKKNPLVFFFQGFPLAVSTASNIKNILYEVDVPTGTKGGGGSEPEDLANKKRGEFEDTAFWQANVYTDKNGKAQVKFVLPDNLTTWQVESVGITRDTKLGTDYQEFMARKELMVVPLSPRFIIPGDEFSIGAKIFNQSDKDQKLEVSIIDSSLEMVGNAVEKIKIKKNETATIYFKTKAPDNKIDGEHKFTVSAKASDLEDVVEKRIEITRNDTYETTATAGYSKNSKVNEYVFLPSNVVKDKGELSINTSATLAVFLSDALNYMLSYPYGCSEQIASKLDSIAIIKSGLNLENIGDKFEIKNIEIDGKEYTMDELVEIGLKKIYETQKANGGFSYYKEGSFDDFYLSLHIAETLKNLKDAGYKIDDASMTRLFNYLNYQAVNRLSILKTDDAYISVVYVLSGLSDYGKIDDRLINYIRDIEKNDKFINENISNLSLAYLAMILSENSELFNKKFKEKIYDNLENRVEIDSRGAFLRPNNKLIWQFYETSIKDTSLLLKALVVDKRDNSILDRIMRWLLQSRSKDGSWGSTNNTINAMDALTDYLIWQEENESNFDLKVLLNNEEKSLFNYGPETILNQSNLVFPIRDLGFNKLNTLSFEKINKNERNNNFYYDMSLKYYLPVNSIPPRDEGFTITRNFYEISDKEFKNPIQVAKVGDVLKGHIEITLPKERNFVSIEDFIPAGVELINFDLDTENVSLIQDYENTNGQLDAILDSEDEYYNYWYYYDSWQADRKINPDMKELRDDRIFLFKNNLSEGTYSFDYYVRVLIPGKFHHLPAITNEMYFPENFGRTGGSWFVVNEK